MIKSKLFAVISSVGLIFLAIVLISGDHNDAPSLRGTKADIADFYAFQAPDSDKLVLVLNLQGLIPAGLPTEQAEFDENVLMEFNIDLNNDLKEDVLIQAIKRRDSMYFFGPFQTNETGLESTINTEIMHKVKISTKEDVFITEENGMKFFAGPREDPFFFDQTQFDAYLAGNAKGGFTDPGTDTYAGTNVLSIVVEVPKAMLGTPVSNVNPFAPGTPTYNMWVETKRKIQ
ncbi:DUF4331 domain-containing protein [Aequorivita sp. H23M31]|uniref:DUF4331 domain-containing protein n=1 Tax=Aequorivita ciconiae TaxID=2494375 RepID=A0A410G6Q1_9FLAO|nr:DUF4331 family protein [Aequorivita sp. H23M31]QAA82957.1 DUF4331 domain-containing protein [Aequorivita sp. H23M31]